MSPQPTPPVWRHGDDLIGQHRYGSCFDVIRPGSTGWHVAEELSELPADAVRLTDETPAEGLLRYIRADRAACLAHIERITTAHEAVLARVTTERDEARADARQQSDLADEYSAAEERLRAERAADLVDLRAAAQDLHDLGEACAGPIRREADAYELAAARVERVIARINHRAGETPDAG